MLCLENEVKISMSSKIYIEWNSELLYFGFDSDEIEIIVSRCSSNNFCNSLYLKSV